jgi:hypothetical protein
MTADLAASLDLLCANHERPVSLHGCVEAQDEVCRLYRR